MEKNPLSKSFISTQGISASQSLSNDFQMLGQMVMLFMKYYDSHGSIILECQNQLRFIKNKHGLFTMLILTWKKNFLEFLKYSQSIKDYSEVFFKINHLLSYS